MRRLTLSRTNPSHPAHAAGPSGLRPSKSGQTVPEARERVLERIRRALAAGDETAALCIARVLERRFDAAQRCRAGIGCRVAARQG